MSDPGQLIDFVKNVKYDMDKQKQVDLDLLKTFDTIPHHHLLIKLHHYGIQGMTQRWISAWLAWSTQCVLVDGDGSGFVQVILECHKEPFLVLYCFSCMYINDICNNISSSIRQFADGCIL